MPTNRPDDLRRDRRRRERQLVLLVLLTLVVVGSGVVLVFFGIESFLGSLPCLLAGAGAIAILYLALIVSERWTNR